MLKLFDTSDKSLIYNGAWPWTTGNFSSRITTIISVSVTVTSSHTHIHTPLFLILFPNEPKFQVPSKRWPHIESCRSLTYQTKQWGRKCAQLSLQLTTTQTAGNHCQHLPVWGRPLLSSKNTTLYPYGMPLVSEGCPLRLDTGISALCPQNTTPELNLLCTTLPARYTSAVPKSPSSSHFISSVQIYLWSVYYH